MTGFMDGMMDRWAEVDKRRPKAVTRKKARPEAKIQDAVVKFLMARGWIVVHVNSGVQWSEATNMPFKAYTIRNLASSAGFPDLMAFKGPHFLLMEMKTAVGRLSEKQIAFKNLCRKTCVDYHIVRSVEDVEGILSELEQVA